MAIIHQIRPRYKTRNDEIVAGLFQAAGAIPPAASEVVIKFKAAEISYLMALLHGGEWRVEVEVDHHAGFVLIAPRLP